MFELQVIVLLHAAGELQVMLSVMIIRSTCLLVDQIVRRLVD